MRQAEATVYVSLYFNERYVGRKRVYVLFWILVVILVIVCIDYQRMNDMNLDHNVTDSQLICWPF